MQGAEQPAALRAVDVTDSAVEGSKEDGQLAGVDEGATSADDLEEEELYDIDYVMDEEEDGTEIDGLDSMYGEGDDSGADSAAVEEEADASLAKAGA